MTTVFDRLQFNFETERFGDAAKLSSGAANTLNLLANNTSEMSQWQKEDLAAGAINRADYFKNPTSTYNSNMMVSTATIAINALSCANANAIMTSIFHSANNLIVELNAYQSHTDNISGLVVVTDPSIPSYDTASGLGQINMLNLTKSDGEQQNTTAILGCFTSLFIQDILEANTIQLNTYSQELANSITMSTDIMTGMITYSSNLSSIQLQEICDYANSTTSILNTRRLHDWNFYRNSKQVMSDSAFLQQFSNLGGSNRYLINNVVGTTNLINKLNS